MRPPKRRKPSNRSERRWEVPSSVSRCVRWIFEDATYRHVFGIVSVVLGVDAGRREFFHGKATWERAMAGGRDVESVILIPLDFDNPADVLWLKKACFTFKGSCCYGDGPANINPLAN